MQNRPYNFWISDHDTPFEFQSLAVKAFLHSERSAFQNIDIVLTGGYGKALLLDGRLQSAERDEYRYHESLVHPAMVLGEEVERVLIIGGGEGATIREVLRHPSVTRVVMVDIDNRVIACAREHLLEFHRGAFDDPKVEIHIGDGREFVEEKKEPFDLVILDVSEPIEEGPGYLLYTKEFYEMVGEILTGRGRVVTQACSASLTQGPLFSIIYNTLKSTFGSALAYRTFVPSFGSPWGFSMAGNLKNLSAGRDVDGILKERKVTGLNFYDGETDRYLFSLPGDLRKLLAEEERIFTDDTPPPLFHLGE